MNILLDLELILDLIIPAREGHELAKRIIKIATEHGYSIWLSASTVGLLYSKLLSTSKLPGAEKKKWADAEIRKFLSEVKIFSVSGYSVRKVFEAEGSELDVAILNFRRIAPRGVVISKFEEDKSEYGIISPQEFIKNHEKLADSFSVPILDLQSEYLYMAERIDESVLHTIAEAQYIMGPAVSELEKKLADYLGAKYCVTLGSGTDALLLSLRALAIKKKGKEYWDKDDLVITTPFTFTATGDTILRSGATPLFVDIDPVTHNINPEEVRRVLTESSYSEKIVGIVPVHLYGLACDMDRILELADQYRLFVVEDVAQAFGGTWRDKKLGVLGHVGALSFFPTKNLGSFGDAGAVVTNDHELASLIRALRVHGGRSKYDAEYLGYKSRLDTIQAAILLEKLGYVEELNSRRKVMARFYNDCLEKCGDIKIPLVPSGYPADHVYHQYTIRVGNGDRDKLMQFLAERKIQVMVYYPLPLHKMKVFHGRHVCFGNLEQAEKAAKEVVSLPIEPLLGKKKIEFVVESIKHFFNRENRTFFNS